MQCCLSKIELETEKKGKTVCRTAAMIAAVTINNNAKLYTFNLRNFKAVRDLAKTLPVNITYPKAEKWQERFQRQERSKKVFSKRLVMFRFWLSLF